jgi:hypothetical protein
MSISNSNQSSKYVFDVSLTAAFFAEEDYFQQLFEVYCSDFIGVYGPGEDYPILTSPANLPGFYAFHSKTTGY